MLVTDSQVHIWGADTPDRPWPPGGVWTSFPHATMFSNGSTATATDLIRPRFASP